MIGLAGAGIAVCTVFFAPRAFDWWSVRGSSESYHRTYVAYPSDRISAHAPVFLWDEDVPKDETPWRERESLTLRVRDVGVFADGVEIELGSVRRFIDAKIAHEKEMYLVVVPDDSTAWRHLWRVLDEARQSDIEIVFLKPE